MNVLYPTDLMSHPFQVQELDAPPPAVLIPPNVSSICDGGRVRRD